jgi:hypothetical protein
MSLTSKLKVANRLVAYLRAARVYASFISDISRDYISDFEKTFEFYG